MHHDRLVVKELYECGYSLHFGIQVWHMHIYIAIVKWLQEICYIICIWRTGVAPLDWRSATIVPMHNKGSRKVCNNYSGISLLRVTKKKIMEEQAGFKSAW